MNSMSDKKKVSIIVPVYDVADYLSRCLDSCVYQTLDDVEVIVVNDCSPDERDTQIMREYENRYPQKIRCFWNSENKKQGGARNTGINAAKGEYLFFVDSDDYITIEACDRLYSFAKERDADLVFFDCFSCRDGETKIWHSNVNAIQRSVCFQFARRSLIIDNRLYFPENQLTEDLVAVLWYSAANKIVRLPIILYHYMQREGSTMTSQLEGTSIGYAKCFEYALNTEYFQKCADKEKEKIVTYYLNVLVKRYTTEEFAGENFEYCLRYFHSVCQMINISYGQTLLGKRNYEVIKYIGQNKELDRNKYFNFFKDLIRRLIICEIRKSSAESVVIWGAGSFGRMIASYLQMANFPFEITDSVSQEHGYDICDTVVIPFSQTVGKTIWVAAIGAYDDICKIVGEGYTVVDMVSF